MINWQTKRFRIFIDAAFMNFRKMRFIERHVARICANGEKRVHVIVRHVIKGIDYLVW